MKKSRKKIFKFALIALIVSVLGITIVYAAMSKNIISIYPKQKDWNIHFANLSKAKINGSAYIVRHPRLTCTHIGDFAVSLSKPGDSITYEFDIVNEGSIDAKIGFYTGDTYLCLPRKHDTNCDWDGDGFNSKEDLHKINENITYRLYYKDTKSKIRVGDILKKKSSKRVVLVLSYNEESNELPVGKIQLNNLDKLIEYIQLYK